MTGVLIKRGKWTHIARDNVNTQGEQPYDWSDTSISPKMPRISRKCQKHPGRVLPEPSERIAQPAP